MACIHTRVVVVVCLPDRFYSAIKIHNRADDIYALFVSAQLFSEWEVEDQRGSSFSAINCSL